MVRLILQGKGTNNIQHLQEKMFKILTAGVKKKEAVRKVLFKLLKTAFFFKILFYIF